MIQIVVESGSNGVTRLTLDRPDRANALSADLGDALLAALDAATADGTRVLVLGGHGRSFSGGFDFGCFETSSHGDLVLRFVRIEQVLQRLWTAPFISIARVHGPAYGAGADLVAACSYRVGLPRARFRFPGFRFGVALGTRRLAAVIGTQPARDILLSGCVLSAEAALGCGLLTHLTDGDHLDATVDALIDQARGLDPPSLATLLANTRRAADHAGEDMAALVASLARPGLHHRIAEYRANEVRSRAASSTRNSVTGNESLPECNRC